MRCKFRPSYAGLCFECCNVDMYVDGAWAPVVISGGTYKYSRHHLVRLQDFEFDIELPVTKSQLL